MSINSLTNDEIRRQSLIGQGKVTKVPRTDNLAAVNVRGLTEIGIQENPVGVTFNALVKYIPTEVVTLYVAAASATPSLKAMAAFVDGRLVYWSFAAITPIMLLLLYASKRANDGQAPLPQPKGWPWWKMSAATIAYLVWALAVPGNPYITGDSGAIVAGFGAVIISSLLTLLEPIFERPGQSLPPTNTSPPVGIPPANLPPAG